MSRKARRLIVFAIGCAIALAFGNSFDAPLSHLVRGLPGAIVIYQLWNPLPIDSVSTLPKH